MSRGRGFTERPCVTIGNSVLRGIIGGGAARQILKDAVADGTFTPSIHGREGDTWNAFHTRMLAAEAGVIQSFPWDFPWQGKKGEQAKQIGNAIPVLLAEAILKEVVQ